MNGQDDIEDPDDFDPENATAADWIDKAYEIFVESGDDWTIKVNELADSHPSAIYHLKIAIKDFALVLPKDKRLELDRLDKRPRKP